MRGKAAKYTSKTHEKKLKKRKGNGDQWSSCFQPDKWEEIRSVLLFRGKLSRSNTITTNLVWHQSQHSTNFKFVSFYTSSSSLRVSVNMHRKGVFICYLTLSKVRPFNSMCLPIWIPWLSQWSRHLVVGPLICKDRIWYVHIKIVLLPINL